MEEKKYLKWYNKVGYGSGDLAANMVYGLLTSFVLIYLTDTVGLNAGIVGTLMMFSKFADGVTDVFFGAERIENATLASFATNSPQLFPLEPSGFVCGSIILPTCSV